MLRRYLRSLQQHLEATGARRSLLMQSNGGLDREIGSRNPGAHRGIGPGRGRGRRPGAGRGVRAPAHHHPRHRRDYGQGRSGGGQRGDPCRQALGRRRHRRWAPACSLAPAVRSRCRRSTLPRSARAAGRSSRSTPGLARVGPESAGAMPGPVCYDQGGEEPTVTDANVVLGYPGSGETSRRRGPAQLGASAHSARCQSGGAAAPSSSARGLRRASRRGLEHDPRDPCGLGERGRDPRGFTLFAFGGNGPLFAAGMATSLGIKRVAVPPAPRSSRPSVCSARGWAPLLAQLAHAPAGGAAAGAERSVR